jgi:hypothetical protein
MSEHREGLPKFVQSRLRQQASAPAVVHPDANVLSAFVEGSLKESERENLLAHLSSCEECREVVSLSLPELDVASLAAVKPSRTWNWNSGILRWGAVAASVIVVAGAVLLLNPGSTMPNSTISNARLSQPQAKSEAPKGEARESQASESAPAAVVDESIAQRKKERGANDEQDKTKALAEGTSKQQEESAFVAVQPPPPPKALNDSPSKTETKPFAANSNSNFSSVRAYGGPSASASNANAPKYAGTGSASYGAASGAVVGGLSANANGKRDSVVAEAQNTHTANFSDLDVKTRNAQQATAAPQQAPPSAQLARQSASLAATQPAKTKEKNSTDEAAAAMQSVEVTSEAAALNTFAPQSQSQMVLAKVASGMPAGKISNGKLLIRRELNSPWQEVPFTDNPKLRTLAIQASNIWVGGAKGVLYHSADAGTTWSLIKGGWSPDSDIVALTFTDSLHGDLRTSKNDRWETPDSGKTWQKVYSSGNR